MFVQQTVDSIIAATRLRNFCLLGVLYLFLICPSKEETCTLSCAENAIFTWCNLISEFVTIDSGFLWLKEKLLYCILILYNSENSSCSVCAAIFVCCFCL